ncbi:MAG: MerR family transcriptional regulator [Deltaproteobacteria bacterium]|jgi:DNA-binding transcriptional MerR regulator|nr:MerR family transcriptional regulator [Deltaproteobacteria bacterium]
MGGGKQAGGQQYFYKLAEVARILEVEKHVLRYWEKEFPQIEPLKIGHRRNLYSQGHLEVFREIKRLLYDERYTVAGARLRLEKVYSLDKGDIGPPANSGQSRQGGYQGLESLGDIDEEVSDGDDYEDDDDGLDDGLDDGDGYSGAPVQGAQGPGDQAREAVPANEDKQIDAFIEANLPRKEGVAKGPLTGFVRGATGLFPAQASVAPEAQAPMGLEDSQAPKASAESKAAEEERKKKEVLKELQGIRELLSRPIDDG